MHLFQNPDLIDKKLLSVGDLQEIPGWRFELLKERLKQIDSVNPVVSVVIAAWNEEVNIFRCLESLSFNRSTIPFEITVVNNNSTDGTQQVLNRLGVRTFFQPLQGCGPARELGQREARGRYILLADADCLYPQTWVQAMTEALQREGVVCVYGKHSFMGTGANPRWQFVIYELLRDFITEVRQFRRPYLNALGLSMGYIRSLGLQEGFIVRNTRGEDGRMCFDLMKHGKIRLVRSSSARVWTLSRTLAKDGGLLSAFKRRAFQQLVHFDSYFTTPIPHNTKTSESHEYSVEQSIHALKEKYLPKFLRRNKGHRDPL